MNVWRGGKTIVVRARCEAQTWTAFRRRALELGVPAEVLLGDAILQSVRDDVDEQRLRVLVGEEVTR